MAISDKLRKFLNKPDNQQLLAENNLHKFLFVCFTELEIEDYRNLIGLLMLQYDDFFGELDGLTPNMFEQMHGIGTVVLNPTVPSIPSECFKDSDITSISGDNVTTISQRAFIGCKNLIHIDLPNVTSIGSHAFGDCTALKQIDLPKTVQTIGIKAFNGCTNLKQINYHGTMEEFKNIRFGMRWDGTFDSSAAKIVCVDGEI